MNRFAFVEFGVPTWIGILAIAASGCSKKGPECQSVISSINELGARLADAQKVTSNSDAKPEEVAAALRPFAVTAKSTSDRLASYSLTVPEIRKIATTAANASSALAASSASMADAAAQMNGLDVAGKTVEDQKRLVDSAEAEIKKLCDATPKHCVELAKVLVAFPAPPDKTDNLQATAAWTNRLNAWASELAKISIAEPSLKTQVVSFETGWKNFAAAMTTLVGISETAKRYDDFAKAFNAQIDLANRAIGEANDFCKG